jgi:hypothetical protein
MNVGYEGEPDEHDDKGMLWTILLGLTFHSCCYIHMQISPNRIKAYRATLSTLINKRRL